MSKRKVLITGGTGLLASNLAQYKKNEWDILLVTRNHSSPIIGTEEMKLDLTDLEALQAAFTGFKPDLVIHTAGLANVEECEKNYDSAFLSNVTITKNIARVCQSLHYKLIHISTDHFSNQSLEISTEEDIGLPMNAYAETKLIGDLAVMRECPSALIVRTNFFGWGNANRISFSDFIIHNLRENKTITLFEDVYYTPILIDELADAMEALVDKNLSGVFNIVSSKKISKYDFGFNLAKVFGLDQTLITKGSIKDRDMTRRPLNMSLNNQKMVEHLGEPFNFNYLESLKKLKASEKRKVSPPISF